MIYFRRMHDNVTPIRHGSEQAAGLDIPCGQDAMMRAGECLLVGTGYQVAVPPGYGGFLMPRSGSGHSGLVLGNLTGVIDSDYRGELKVSLWNRTQDWIHVKRGDYVAQMVVMPVVTQYQYTDFLPDTVRGDGGFGSTDK